MAKENDKSGFDTGRIGTGTAEWAETRLNISKGCPHGCLYCYACHIALRYKSIGCRDEWRNEKLTQNAFRTSFPLKKGVVMFPSSHDITPLNLYRYTEVLRLALEAGNQMLIVSKPHLDSIQKIVGEMVRFRSQILFRFTIGSLDDDLTHFWEPGAPLPGERLAALAHTFNAGYDTSVSIEPMLAGVEGTLQVVEAVYRHVSETIWIGKLRKPRERADMTAPGVARAVELIKGQQSDSEILRLGELLSDNPKIRWKDSISKILTPQNLGIPEGPLGALKIPARMTPSKLFGFGEALKA